MTTSDQNQSQTHGGEQAEARGEERGGPRHSRRRRGGRPEQQRQPQPPSRRTESGLNIEELRELTELFSAHGLTDFEFENADIRIRLSRNVGVPAAGPLPAMQAAAAPPAAPAPVAQAAPTPAPQESAAAASASSAGAAASEEELHVITSPIVGTFYRASSPAAEPFVKVGSQVEADTVVCIIEAMKLMNEIQAETTGTVAKIYVENGQPVEYGQPLFGVKK